MVLQKVNNYQKISTLQLIFAVVIHLQNNTFVGTKVSYFGTYLSIIYDEMLYRVLYLDNKKTSLFLVVSLQYLFQEFISYL